VFVGVLVALTATTVWWQSAAVPLALVTAWIVVPLLVRRGWWHVTAGILAAGMVATHFWAAVPSVAMTAIWLVVALALATITSSQSDRRLPPWLAAAPAAVCACLAGVLLMVGPGRSWQVGSATAALALAPSLLASGAAGAVLARIWDLVPHALAGVDVIPAGGLMSARRAARRAAVGVIVRALLTLVFVTSAGSMVLLTFLPESEAAPMRPALWVFAVFALVLMLAIAVEALSGIGRAVLVLASADAAALGALAVDVTGVMAVAGVAATLVAAALLAAPLRAPDAAFSRVL
jgi:hypothetical protein